jgi:hypothetical protein
MARLEARHYMKQQLDPSPQATEKFKSTAAQEKLHVDLKMFRLIRHLFAPIQLVWGN